MNSDGELSVCRRAAWRSANSAKSDADAETCARFLDALPIGVFVVDHSGKPFYANAAALELLGGEAVTDRPLEALAVAYRAHRAPTGELYPTQAMPLYRALQGETCAADDVELRHGASPLRLQVWAAPLRDPEGRVKFAVAAFAPLESSGREHAASGRAQDPCQMQRMQALGEQTAEIAHEINTPMQYIGDNTAFLGITVKRLLDLAGAYERLVQHCQGQLPAAELDAFQRELKNARVDFLRQQAPAAVDQSLAGIDQVRTIVQALKEFSHPGAEDEVEVDLNHVAQLACTLTRGTWRHRAELELCLDPGLEPIHGHPQELTQAVTNLIVNASHAVEERQRGAPGGPPGKIVIRTRKGAGGIELSVEDNGSGIPEAIQGRVMEPFFTTKPVGIGTGQGLPLVHGIVTQRHRGRLSFETQPGSGTTFTIWLPEARNG